MGSTALRVRQPIEARRATETGSRQVLILALPLRHDPGKSFHLSVLIHNTRYLRLCSKAALRRYLSLSAWGKDAAGVGTGPAVVQQGQ